MQNQLTHFLFSILMSLFFVNTTLSATNDIDPVTTIIMIQGQPHLVDLADNGVVVMNYGHIPSYFTSSLGHDEIVSKGLKSYSRNLETATERIRFFVFEDASYQWDEEAVNNIRELAIQYDNNPNSKLRLTVAYQSNVTDSENAQRIVKMLSDFGINRDDISIIKKQSVSKEFIQYVKAEVVPSLKVEIRA